MSKSTGKRTVKKSEKPPKLEGFPLFPHSSGRWAKTINKRTCYFGYWKGRENQDWGRDDALSLYLKEKENLYAGRKLQPESDNLDDDSVTVLYLANAFLTMKGRRVRSDELSGRSLMDYHRTCEMVVQAFGKDQLVSDLKAADFEQLRDELASGRGPVALGNEIRRVRSLFKYAYDSELIEKPVRFGQFKQPAKRVMKLDRQRRRRENGRRMFSAEDLRVMLDAIDGKPVTVKDNEEPITVPADPTLKAMLLLGINAGLNNKDCSDLQTTFIDFESGWLDFPREKTAEERRCPLWPETLAALKAAIAVRPGPADANDGDCCFLTSQGHRLVRTTKGKRFEHAPSTNINVVTDLCNRLLRSLNIKRHGVSFGALRHTFETVAGETKDQTAVNLLMGHADDSMAAVYREEISDDRLKSVVDHVRGWLFDPKEGSP